MVLVVSSRPNRPRPPRRGGLSDQILLGIDPQEGLEKRFSKVSLIRSSKPKFSLVKRLWLRLTMSSEVHKDTYPLERLTEANP